MVLPTGTKGSFSPGGKKNAEANANLGHRSKVCSLVVHIVLYIVLKSQASFYKEWAFYNVMIKLSDCLDGLIWTSSLLASYLLALLLAG